jgi:hypothetical protein
VGVGELIDDGVVVFELIDGGLGVLEVVVGRGDQRGHDEDASEESQEAHVDK